MTVIIFAGPTISRTEILERLDAEIRPPARMGDIYLATQTCPAAIGLIDGYFQGVPSVWHKEILWAIEQEVTVFGAASMGALRAAELEAYGMKGVGKIFEAYRDEEFEDDDEVAVLHGPEEMGYPPLCEPMLNIRATLNKAVSEQIIDKQLAADLIGIAKAQFFPERNWDNLLRAAEKQDVMGDAGRTLGDWLAKGIVNQKHEDAIAMLESISGWLDAGAESVKPTCQFEWTVMWDRVVTENSGDPFHLAEKDQAIIEELRLLPDYYVEIKRRAVSRHLLNAGKTGEIEIDQTSLSNVFRQFREKHGLFSRQKTKAWCDKNGINENELQAFIEEEAHLEELGHRVAKKEPFHFLTELRADGNYEKFARRAEMKIQLKNQQTHTLKGKNYPIDGNLGLRIWYFETWLKKPLPANLETYLRKIDLDNSDQFDSMLAWEFKLLQTCGSED
jgi:hypothetical protein